MPDYPLVSIVTPSYNQVAYLEATMRSVLDQDYPNIEYLVVDGASTDGSVEIIQRYSQRLTWWVSEKDTGQSEAINKGFHRACGEFVGWLNSDDIYMPGAVAAAVKIFASHPQAGVVYGDALAIDARGQPFNLMCARQFTLVDLMAFSIIYQPAAFMRRSVLEEAGYLNPNYHLLLDNLLWMEMSRLAPIIYEHQTWAGARFHEQAKNRTRGAAYGQEARALFTDLKSRDEFKDVIRLNERHILAGVERFDAFYLTDAGKPREALGAYSRAFHLSPWVTISDWKHILLALFSLLGFKWVRRFYDWLRTRRLDRRRSKSH